jgi:hypothetical protein
VNGLELHEDAVVIDGLIVSNWSREVFEAPATRESMCWVVRAACPLVALFKHQAAWGPFLLHP